MAVPARRTSKTKKRMRRGHIKLTVPNMHFDAATGEYRLSHHVSPKGFYKGEQVVKKAEAASDAGSDTSGSDTSASA